MSVGKTIQALRESKHMTQKELAADLGISISSMQKWEIGNRDLSTDQLIQVSKYFGVSVDYILGIKNKDVDICFYNQIGELTEEQKKDVVQFAEFLRSKNDI